MNIEISNSSEIEVDELAIVNVAFFTLLKMGIHAESELSITLVDEAKITELHIEWMDLPGPTDVLSFPMDEMRPHSAGDGPGVVGDIVLCPSFAQAQAKEHSLQDELSLLTVHGVLHLLGYDHAELAEERAMFELQDTCLAEWKAQR
ncbi:MAG: rRNA maturation RNase YbeY [Actinomycetes bacterium]|jgi:probable rRNA maturation factor